jgi:hypothetical protein
MIATTETSAIRQTISTAAYLARKHKNPKDKVKPVLLRPVAFNVNLESH